MRTHLLFGAIGLLGGIRLWLALARMRLYRSRREEFQKSDPAHIKAEWRRTLGAPGRWTAAWVGSVLLAVGLSPWRSIIPKRRQALGTGLPVLPFIGFWEGSAWRAISC